VTQYLNLFNARGVVKKSAFNPNAVCGNAPNGEELVHTTAPNGNHHALKNLDAFAVAFHDANVHVNCVAGVEIRPLIFDLLGGLVFDCLD
jgi:hypothetical protein